VEVRDDAFVEGAWDRPFEDFRFDLATILVGSGVRISGDTIVLGGPSDMHERLYAIRRDGELHVSPSLALSGSSLDPDEPHYYLDFVNAYRAGIRDRRKRIRLLHGRQATMHDVCNLQVTTDLLQVTPDLRVARVEKPWGASPRRYAEYSSLLQTTLQQVLASAADPARRQPFRPVCMISRGYDSVAVAALASRAGCRAARPSAIARVEAARVR
jgi:hypothetical protein